MKTKTQRDAVLASKRTVRAMRVYERANAQVEKLSRALERAQADRAAALAEYLTALARNNS
jgi:hypothetical protein